jgi:ubiquinone/menaquinone biosynthesis C-methylase UbiE
MATSNKRIYEEKKMIRKYSDLYVLQKPEQTILNNFKDRLKKMKMLDIGVGGGRTTLHFAKIAKEYVAIDYSKNMISACKERFRDFPKWISFKVCDVRSMNVFENNYFDFVLFSFNGIDYISHKDRLKALREIKRVGRPDGYLFFSTHNLQRNFEKEFKIAWRKNPIPLSLSILTHFIFKTLNGNVEKMKKTRDYLLIRDGDAYFRLLVYYIKPEAQVNQLLETGFRNIKIYSLNTGDEITNKTELNSAKDNWLYYLCNF